MADMATCSTTWSATRTDRAIVYQLEKGATVLAEAWDTNPASSQNHCMLGHAEEWFYRGLAGIVPDPSSPGFRRFSIRPQIVGDLTWVAASYDSMLGRIACGWERQGGHDRDESCRFRPERRPRYMCRQRPLPPSRKATGPPPKPKECDCCGWTGDHAVFEVESGSYRFSARSPEAEVNVKTDPFVDPDNAFTAFCWLCEIAQPDTICVYCRSIVPADTKTKTRKESTMLVLSRQRDESIVIGDNVVVTIVDIRGDKVRLGIQAPVR